MGYKKSESESSETVDIDALIATFGAGIQYWESQEPSGVLVRCRVGDFCRDHHQIPVSETDFESSWQSLEDESRKRFCLMSESLSLPTVASRIASILDSGDSGIVVQRFAAEAQRLALLKLELLRESDVRLEEFARHFCSMWDLKIEGETKKKSQARLNDIDFERLMNEAELARESAEDRMAYLRMLQEEQEETRRPRRGKW